MKQVIFLFILATNILFSQEKTVSIFFSEQPNLETKNSLFQLFNDGRNHRFNLQKIEISALQKTKISLAFEVIPKITLICTLMFHFTLLNGRNELQNRLLEQNYFDKI